MQIKRKAEFATLAQTVARQMDFGQADCLGCTSCNGICQALIDALILPKVVLKDAMR